MPLLSASGQRPMSALGQFINAPAATIDAAPPASQQPLLLEPMEGRVDRPFGVVEPSSAPSANVVDHSPANADSNSKSRCPEKTSRPTLDSLYLDYLG